MNTSAFEISEIRDKEVIFSRRFKAPIDLVWKAWATPEHLAVWFGPDDFTLTTHKFDLKPGGEWNFIMHGPDGTDYTNLIRYVEVDKPNKLVYEQRGADATADVAFTATITFEAVDNQHTQLTLSMVFPTAEALQYVVENFGAFEGGIQTLGRLAVLLEDLK